MALQCQIGDRVDHVAPAFPQVRQRGAAGDHGSAHIDPVGPLPQRGIHALDIAIVPRDFGTEQRSIVVQHIELSEVAQGGGDHRLDRAFVLEIERHRDRTGQFLRQRGRRVEGDVGNGDPGPRAVMRRAVAEPIPPAPPVTMATFPSRRMASMAMFLSHD